ncbi:hypothetical protein UR09_00980 [Candidatus Nitromaritima sp. SCGC AAA799-A02]|nr:hypothetical protein UR09_00980 [Candidatus Nitromaritima sp. SCGC AAA799-A02]
MNDTLNIFGILLVGTLVFLSAINYMADNIEDFESVPLPPKKPKIISTNNPMMEVDATSRSTWTLVDFSTGKSYTVKDIEKEKDKLNLYPWDMGFQRTKIITNGGLTNPKGNVGVINMGPIDIDSVSVAPATGYLQDDRSFGKVINKAIADWYIYRTRTHNIESQNNVYAVRMADGGYLKMRILNYYCGREESECRSIMCTREEAACIAIEYVLPKNNGRYFPAPALTQAASPQAESVN